MNRIAKMAVVMILFFVSTANSQYRKELLYIYSNLNEGHNQKAGLLLSKADTTSFKLADRAFYRYLQGIYSNNTNSEGKAIPHLLAAKKLYIRADSISKAMNINLEIAQIIHAQENNNNGYLKYLKEYLNYAVRTNDPEKLAAGYGNMAMFITGHDNHEALKYYKKALAYSKGDLTISLHNNLANLYNEKLNKPDSGLYYLKKDILYLQKNNDNGGLYHNYMNQASSYFHMGDHKMSDTYLKKADSLPLKNYVLKSKQYIYEGFYQNYAAVNDFKNAYNYLLLSKKIGDSINITEQNIAINDIQTKYDTKEKELENIKLKDKDRTKTNLLYAFAGLLLAVSVIGWLILKNARRKEKISRQEKLIEQQKLEKALKDYELHSIDLMLEGQEKERQRIANDLHDNLGSMLATLKINFENLKLRKNELRDEENRLYEKTDELIEEAYQKVRRLAHAKNAGVFANEGLIPAIKKLAEKISVPGKLNIQVDAFGFDDRLENTLEITIFRIVQELATNIIKHSQASEASVNLTHHDDNINIIIEDNGIGLDHDAASSSDGMGIGSIRKKISQLEGQFNIDSSPGNGTTIIIDLPI